MGLSFSVYILLEKSFITYCDNFYCGNKQVSQLNQLYRTLQIIFNLITTQIQFLTWLTYQKYEQVLPNLDILLHQYWEHSCAPHRTLFYLIFSQSNYSLYLDLCYITSLWGGLHQALNWRDMVALLCEAELFYNCTVYSFLHDEGTRGNYSFWHFNKWGIVMQIFIFPMLQYFIEIYQFGSVV